MGKSLVTGIDIGHHSIKAVVLKSYQGAIALVDYQELPIESDIFSDNHMLNYQKIVKKLKELRKSLPRFSHKVALSVPDNAVISKELQIDRGLEAREREFAIFEAFSHQSPFPIEELSFDFVPIEATTLNSVCRYQVYATRKDLVESRIQAVTKAGYTPVLLDVQAHGLAQLWRHTAHRYQRQQWILLDVGFSQSSLCIDFNNKAPLCKELPIGTQMIEALISSEGLRHHSTEQFIHTLIEKLQRQRQLIASMHEIEIEGIWLCGGGAVTPLLAEEIARRLAIPCELLNPLTLFEGSVNQRQAEILSGYRYATAAGLAMRGIDWLERKHVA
ncbi:type IV pilus assembly protein PilM [Vibrio orientalis CIP 102891 = ATCC 33934]|uniref:Fimbrial assembly protein PilM putative n=1 Tax=Vibrio orientalis CIP 102891 = ATCC 33934 TaxID=675816 RepID=C9QNG9_VIBOR|nr:type IV pilus assembly protein PilM [Vibrio orientalis]EEX93496.1 fimbrial assembly protein PilM putative [Vibrio orientalis CIP 102891 = ATCC 33934]EGU50277.1 type IV pilus assembly protein PilM [Vibrio orientalis CIP 102891 = ATCC 33934]